ncbi:MAG: hypothetical protein R6U64_03565 [Bacteroidales bacterium]
MKSTSGRLITFLFIFLIFGGPALTNPFTIEGNGQLSVFLDASFHLDEDFVREQIPIVNYVRDKEDADVHILITRDNAGSGGYNFFISFIGRRNFQDLNYELTYWAPSTSTSDEIRRGYTNTIMQGLAPFISYTSMSSRLVMSVDKIEPVVHPKQQLPQKDPWDHWIFELYGGGNFSMEETRRNISSRFGFFADRVTPEWKIRLRPYLNFSELRFITSDQDTIISASHRHGYNIQLIKSINDNWSAGLFSSGLSSTFHNMNAYADLTPAIEYSLYPYEEATRRSITFAYRVGSSYSNYIQTTIFAKDEELLFNHSLEATIRFQQTWGNVRAGLSGSNYFHDFAINRAELFGNLNLRLIQGLSFNASIHLNMINDQLSIPAGDLSLEEILLMQKQRSTSYSFSGSIGLSYTFGSRFQSPYNPRL